jgi:2-polyprenyl-6-methoxyphenol hydroxylase-like FAD-dependent oxidoreductase
VLRRYERWRKSENLIALGLVDGLNRLFSTSDEMLGWVRRTGLGFVDGSALAKRFFMGRAMGTSGELPEIAR